MKYLVLFSDLILVTSNNYFLIRAILVWLNATIYYNDTNIMQMMRLPGWRDGGCVLLLSDLGAMWQDSDIQNYWCWIILISYNCMLFIIVIFSCACNSITRRLGHFFQNIFSKVSKKILKTFKIFLVARATLEVGGLVSQSVSQSVCPTFSHIVTHCHILSG